MQVFLSDAFMKSASQSGVSYLVTEEDAHEKPSSLSGALQVFGLNDVDALTRVCLEACRK